MGNLLSADASRLFDASEAALASALTDGVADKSHIGSWMLLHAWGAVESMSESKFKQRAKLPLSGSPWQKITPGYSLQPSIHNL